MASSTLAGDRRWAPTRKSGMTVLGKVPKPINLPSQRSENHGLDPNVEIVPKGTITWGSRVTSATPNAWASSGLSSPNTDGSAGSPVNARPSSGGTGPRPSSGGSGARPSTAGSDRSHELASSAWGPNSRPSSSSGVSASNQSLLVTTRPPSAETRPGSSQLSRFAENSTDNSVAWGPTKAADRLGAASSRNDGFTLSSGDFPTLGSEKNSESRGHSSHGRPSSASGRAATQKEAHEPPSSDGNGGTYSDHNNGNSWKVNNYPYGGGGTGTPPDMEKWQRDTQQAPPYGSVNVPPHQFEPWHGPPVHSPDGVWYGGGPAGGPFRPPGPHGSYPVESFPYYSPQLPARPCSNSQAVLRPGAGPGPGGYNTKNVESYAPHLRSDSYMAPGHPVIAYRPGVYPGTVPYDGYYGPPHASFHHSVEREVSVMEMNSQTAVSNRFNQNASLDSEKFHARPGSHDPFMTKTQKESDQAQVTRQGQYKVLLKQHGQEESGAQEKRWQSEIRKPLHVERGDLQGASLQDSNLEGNSRKDERTPNLKFMPSEKASSQPASNRQGHSPAHVVTDLSQTSNEAADDILTKKTVPSTVQGHDLQQYPMVKKNATLIEKIEGLNNKARIAESHNEAGPFLSREKAKNSKVANAKVDQATRAISINDAPGQNHAVSKVVTSACELGASLEEKKRESSDDQKVASGPLESQSLAASVSDSQEDGKRAHSAQSHRKGHVVQSRAEFPVKSRLNNQDDKEWIKTSSGKDSLMMAAEKTGEDGTRKCLVDRHAPPQEAAVVEESDHATNGGDGSYAASSLDPVDHKAERAKLKEIAAQRARQLMQEEEERTREQKAKALAKLEELNRRTSAQSLNQNLNHTVPPSNDVPQEQDLRSPTANEPGASIVEVPDSILVQDSGTVKEVIESEVKHFGELTNKSSNVASWPSNSDLQGAALPHEASLALRQDARTTENITYKTTSHSHDSSVSKMKQVSYRRRQNISHEKNVGEKPLSNESMGSPKNLNDVTVHVSGNDGLPSTEEPSAQQRKKNNRGSRYKNKLDETPPGTSLPSSVHSGEKAEQDPTKAGKSQPSSSSAEAFSVPSPNISDILGNQDSRDASITSSDAGRSPAREESHGRVSNQWKPLPHRKLARNHQVIRPIDKFHGSDTAVWAPVKPHYKNSPSEEPEERESTEPSNNSSGKNGLDIQNSMKTKRAEMERYVPKQVTKELSQQENSQHASSSLNQAGSVNNAGKSDSESKSPECGRLNSVKVEKSEFAVDTKVGYDNKSNRRGRVHTWRQRNSAGSSSIVQSATEDLVSSDPIKTVQEPSDQHLSSKLDNSSKVPLKHDEWKSIGDNMVQSELIIPVPIKDQGVTSKQKRQQFKAHKFGGSNHAPADDKDLQCETGDKSGSHSPALDLNESDMRNTSRAENQNASNDHARSHWQPKSQAYPRGHRSGNRGSGVQRVGSQSDRFNKDPSQDFKNHSLQNEDRNALTQGDNFTEIRNARHDEAKSEWKILVDQPKEQTSISNKPTNAELAPRNIDAHHEQSVSSAYRHDGQHNGRFNRGQEARYKVRDLGQDGGKQNFQMNEDRRKNSSYYEYQQIGSHNKSSDSCQHNQASEEAEGGPRPRGSRNRERSHNYSRRGGHFYGRGGGSAVHVGDYHNSGE